MKVTENKSRTAAARDQSFLLFMSTGCHTIVLMGASTATGSRPVAAYRINHGFLTMFFPPLK